MTPHQILIVAIRLLAIFWLLGVLAQLPILVVTFDNVGHPLHTSVIWVGIQFAISVVLWVFPATFASMLLRAGKTPAPTGDIPFDEWRSLSFIAIGIFMLARALPDLAYWIVVASGHEPLAVEFTLDQKASVVATVLEVAIGGALVLGAAGLSSLIERLRRAGVPG